MSDTQKRKRIAVLGGGMTAMTSVFQLTQTPDWRDKYDITIYTKGWRIGGKGASGRNPDIAQRIEEHGLHIWFGFYDNAFNLIRKVYEGYNEVGNSSPLKDIESAFTPQDFIPLMEHIDGKWESWNMSYPPNDMKPGAQKELLPLWQYAKMGLEMMYEILTRSEFNTKWQQDSPPFETNKGCLGQVLGVFVKDAEKVVETIGKSLGEKHLKDALKHVETHGENIKHPGHEGHKGVLTALFNFWDWLKNIIGDVADHDKATRHVFIMLDLCATMIKGVMEDHLLRDGLDQINNIEFRDWLTQKGAADVTVHSTYVQALYDVGFAYTDGDIKKPNYEAGNAIRIILRLALSYRGHFMYRMNAGMGDTIFTPVYKALSHYKPTEDQGGVTLKLFHEINNLRLNEDKNRVEAIEMFQQAHMKPDENGNPRGIEDYDPFVIVDKIPCWPSVPIYDQLEEGDELKADNINLESHWSPWEDICKKKPDFNSKYKKVLKAGEDFDIVILGTPLATLPYIASELIDASAKWQKMMETLQTTQTQAYQLWLKPNLKEVGWDHPSPIMTSYVEPVDTWADMYQLLDREDWPEGHDPGSIAYFCGVFKDADVIPPSSDHSFPKGQKDRVYDHLKDYAENNSGAIWPKAAPADNPDGLDYEKLIDIDNGSGEQRLKAQFWRANIDPSERYTLTNVGSSQHRLDADQTDIYDNLYLTGDWIQTYFNYGCIECCTMAGTLTARAISGIDIPIVGLHDVL